MHSSFVSSQYLLQDKEDKRLKKCFTLGSRLLDLTQNERMHFWKASLSTEFFKKTCLSPSNLEPEHNNFLHEGAWKKSQLWDQ